MFVELQDENRIDTRMSNSIIISEVIIYEKLFHLFVIRGCNLFKDQCRQLLIDL